MNKYLKNNKTQYIKLFKKYLGRSDTYIRIQASSNWHTYSRQFFSFIIPFKIITKILKMLTNF